MRANWPGQLDISVLPRHTERACKSSAVGRARLEGLARSGNRSESEDAMTREQALRTKRQAQSDAQPVGWQLVPKEPTAEMLKSVASEEGEEDALYIWHGMLAAAPAARAADRERGMIEAKPDWADEPYDPQVIIAELQKRIAELEAGNAELQKWLLDKEYQRDAERQRREEAEAEIIRLRGMFVL